MSMLYIILGTRLVCNVFIYLTASKRLLEFNGFTPKTYPGQPPLRPLLLEPRRISLPPDFSSEWKKIGCRRTGRLQYLGKNLTPSRSLSEITKVDS